MNLSVNSSMTLLFSYVPVPRRTTVGRPRSTLLIRCRVECDDCKTPFDTNYKTAHKCEAKTGEHLCCKCWRSFNAKNRTIETRSKLSNSLKGRQLSATHRKNISSAISGEKHGNYNSGKWQGKNEKYNQHIEHWRGKTFAEIFGAEKAECISRKKSAKSSGVNNPMFGKPAPVGSGNGWSGWYHGKYFRSLLELSFIVANPNATSAEGYCKVKYTTSMGVIRTYHPDFVLGDKIIEVKPKKLVNITANLEKFAAARKEFENRFQVFTEDDIIRLTLSQIVELVANGSVEFIDRYKKKYEALLESTPTNVLC